MRMIRLSRVIGNGMAPTTEMRVNTDYIVALQDRNEKDGYGNPQSGTIVQLVVGQAFEVTESVERVLTLMFEE